MTFAEMQTEVFTRLDESSATPRFWELADVKLALNEGLHCISDASEWYETEFLVPLSDFTASYFDLSTSEPMKIDEFDSLPDSLVTAHDKFRILTWGHDFSFWSFLAFRRAFNVQTNRWLRMVDVRDLDEEVTPQWRLVLGEPQVLFIRGGWVLGLFPRTSSGSVKCRVAADPPEMVADSDTPGMPAEFHEGIIEYALYDLLLQDRETAKALLHWTRYLGHEARLSAYVGGRIDRDRIGVFGEAGA